MEDEKILKEYEQKVAESWSADEATEEFYDYFQLGFQRYLLTSGSFLLFKFGCRLKHKTKRIMNVL